LRPHLRSANLFFDRRGATCVSPGSPLLFARGPRSVMFKLRRRVSCPTMRVVVIIRRVYDKLPGMTLITTQTPSKTSIASIRPGDRVRIVQQIAARHYALTAPVEGVVVRIEQKPTGSWFAHGAKDKLWLDRIVIRKDDGEISTLNLDEYTAVVSVES
jgi:hypothetical protein